MNSSNSAILKKKKFPIGIFLMLFTIETALVVAGSGFYFIQSGKKRIAQLEKYTQAYSTTLSEAFAEVAEVSYKNRSYGRLKRFLRKKIDENIIDEAFFTLRDGDLILHSSRKVEKSLKGNIANDEFAYNLDLILRPAKIKSRKVQYTHYNIIGENLPVYDIPIGTKRQHRYLLKKYLYKHIDSSGWLFSRAVFVNRKTVGTVNFIISKKRIFNSVSDLIEDTKKVLVISMGTVFIISLFVSLIVLGRYRGIQRAAVKFLGRGARRSGRDKLTRLNRELGDMPDVDINSFEEELDLNGQAVSGSDMFSGIVTETDVQDDERIITVELLGEVEQDSNERSSKNIRSNKDTALSDINGRNKSNAIRDAIPVIKKR